ncbi:hypothetical protein NEF87_000697 [Candidatus Lokiarchaeum ossiferum]|uniref:Type II secretion system protein GspF domain-containing protein n=1 Tax=Candidatus Lokiarchaeum ossiferum TaxID=2951803 RepID=A0ABY6HNF8_9ARCH|nr:hypothetical protein NEF87_000697 [Candidatus Lokiarchaeum sp. B-35]
MMEKRDEENKKQSFKETMQDVYRKLVDSFQQTLIQAGIQKSIGEYLFKILLPITVGGLGSGIIIGILLEMSPMISGIIFPLSISCFFLGFIIVFIFPYFKRSLRQEQIDTALPMLVTYMGGISTSKASRDQLFENVSRREKSFGLIALEVKRIRTMAKEWNLGYLDSIKKVSATTASSRFGDFLSRFSQALDAGENLEDYFLKEQQSVLNGYISDYTRKLKSLEVLNDMFTALSTSLSFISITFLLMMFLFGSDEAANTRNLFLILGVIELVYIALMVAFYAISPKDGLVNIQRKTAEYEKVLYSFLICVFVFMPILAFITFFLKDADGNSVISLPVFMIIFGISMFYPGYVAEKFEDIIKRRDANFPVFIRTLGATTALLGGSIFDSVNIISREQFGPLTTDIKLLYTQSKFGIDPIIAWQWFSDSTSSSIIDRFLRIFTSSLDIGGNTEIISKFISTNVEKILKLRRDRQQVIGVFKGTLLMLTIINIGIMIFMKDVLFLLNVTMGALQDVQGMNLQLGKPPPAFFTDLYFTIYYLTMPIYACLAIIIPQRGTWMKVTKYLSQYYIIAGLEIIVISQVAGELIGGFGVAIL